MGLEVSDLCGAGGALSVRLSRLVLSERRPGRAQKDFYGLLLRLSEALHGAAFALAFLHHVQKNQSKGTPRAEKKDPLGFGKQAFPCASPGRSFCPKSVLAKPLLRFRTPKELPGQQPPGRLLELLRLRGTCAHRSWPLKTFMP